MVVGLAIRARKRPVVTGAEQMIGAEGEVLAGGWARVHSELWRVRSREALVPGMRVRVSGRQDLVLEVEPISVQKESNHV